MNQKRVVIIVLVLIGLLYILATGLGVKNNAANDGSDFDPAEHPWLSRIGSWNPFGKGFDPSRVETTVDEEGKFTLAEGATEIAITASEVKGDKEYATAELTLESGAATVCFSEDKKPADDDYVAFDQPVNLAVSSSGGKLYFVVTTETAQFRLK